MKVELRFPHIDKNAPPSVQVEQMRAYLFALVEQLQVVISNLPDKESQEDKG
jgi:hypothetical protein